MKAESDPITDDEWLLRRVRIERFRTDKTPITSPNAFEPRTTGRDVDHDGISLYRSACLSSAEEILNTIPEDKRHLYAIVRIPVSLLRELGLTVETRADDRINGHVVIPELNAQAYSENKGSFAALKYRIAEVASEEENIIRRPQV